MSGALQENDSSVVAIIQARMSSQRLPGKVLMPLAGYPLLGHIVKRLKQCKLIGGIVVATSVEKSDDLIHQFCVSEGVECYRGSLCNVMSRFIDILNRSGCRYYVRISGDTPLINSVFIDKQLLALHTHDADLVWLDHSVPVLDGQGAQSARSLKQIASNSQHPDDLEHVGSRYLSENPQEFRIIGMTPPEFYSKLNWRITIDEIRDLKMMQLLYEDLWDGQPIPLDDALTWMKRNPDASNKNQSVKHSAINQQLAAQRELWKQHVDFYCDWRDPRLIIEDGQK